MSASDSVTHWLGQLKAGDHASAQQLWERYFRRLVGLARRKLRGRRRVLADEEDVALSAFDSFCRAAERDCFPRLNDRHDLWQVLVLITARKAYDLMAYEDRARRGGRQRRTAADDSAALERIIGNEPTPQFAALVADEYERLLNVLGSDELRAVALWKMERYSNEEIADKLGCVVRSVERRLASIRKLWEKETQP